MLEKKGNTKFDRKSNLESLVAVKREREREKTRYSLLNDDFLDLLNPNKHQGENTSKNDVRKLIL